MRLLYSPSSERNTAASETKTSSTRDHESQRLANLQDGLERGQLKRDGNLESYQGSATEQRRLPQWRTLAER